MTNFFCAQASRQAAESPIGWAAPRQLFVLIECPPPWTENEFESQAVPANLKTLVTSIDRTETDAMVLLIHNKTLKSASTKFIIFRQQPGLSNGYSKQAAEVANIAEVAPLLSNYLANPSLGVENSAQTRDIIICTHGSHDKCCAKYGNPFYRQAKTIVADLSLNNVRIWQSSHFGGHRFAPTALDFPSGRCYGRLDPKTFTSILTRTGNIQDLQQVYRGWSILSGSIYPMPTQLLEWELIQKYGWDWFSYKVAAQVVEQNEAETWFCVELTFATQTGAIGCYRADVVEDESQALYLIGDCNGTETEKYPKFLVKNLTQVEPLRVQI